MRLRIDSFELIGAERRLKFEPGLNIIVGTIATGKTTLLRCVRALLAGGISNFPRETQQTVQNLAGRVTLGDDGYDIIRPFVSTINAKVEIAGDREAQRLPALRGTGPEDLTYRDWLQEKLGLPKIKVPRIPSQIDSDLSPVTVNDYLMYCYLQQEEIDESVFGHRDRFKNTKRMAVFNIVYGRYDAELAGLEEQLRSTSSELRRLRNWSRTIDEFLEGTAVENRAAIQQEIRETEAKLEASETRAVRSSEVAVRSTESSDIRETLRQAEESLAATRAAVDLASSAEQKNRLVAQLRTQSARLERISKPRAEVPGRIRTRPK